MLGEAQDRVKAQEVIRLFLSSSPEGSKCWAGSERGRPFLSHHVIDGWGKMCQHEAKCPMLLLRIPLLYFKRPRSAD